MSTTWDNSVFDQATIDILAASLDRAWLTAQADERREEYDHDWARNILARRITEMARKGERDRARLALGALCSLRQQEQVRASKERVEGGQHGLRVSA